MKTQSLMAAFSSLPPWISFEGINFELQLLNNGRADDNRLVYAISYVNTESKHKADIDAYGCWSNPFTGGNKGFLYLIENIATDGDFLNAVDDVKTFIIENDLQK